MSVAALVLGAGSGTRFRASLGPAGADSEPPKAFSMLAGQTLLERSLRALGRCSAIVRLQPVLPEDSLSQPEGSPSSWAPVGARLGELGPRLAQPVAGGAERHHSVRAGLAALPDSIEWVAVHDAARPLVLPEEVARVIARAQETGAAFLAAPVRDSLHRVEGSVVEHAVDRSTMVVALTPQVFRRDWLEAAHEKAAAAGAAATDDVALVAGQGMAVHAVAGDPSNLKITTALDLALALAILRERGEMNG